MAWLKTAVCAFIALIFFFTMSWFPQYEAQDVAGAVGISLSPTHGTVAIRNIDGSFQDIARVDASSDYIQLMKKLSLLESGHPSPPYSSGDEMWEDIPRQLRRRSRKGIGLAASQDVAIISALLKDLRTAAESHVGGRVGSVVIAYPRLAALYEEDIRDAADFLGLQTLQGRHFHQPHELVAAYAGYGDGLCSHPSDPKLCSDEEASFLTKDVLSVHVSAGSFVISFERLKQAIDLANWDLPSTVKFEQHDVYAVLEKDVRAMLEEQFTHLKRPGNVSVLCTGEDGSSKATEGAVSRAVNAFGAFVEIKNRGSEFVAARGAAELAWRAQASERDSTATQDQLK